MKRIFVKLHDSCVAEYVKQPVVKRIESKYTVNKEQCEVCGKTINTPNFGSMYEVYMDIPSV